MEEDEHRRAVAGHCPERAMGAVAARVLAVLSVPLTAAAWWTAGAGGAAGALVGLLLVLALFGLTGLALGRLRVATPTAVVGLSLAGVGVRLAGYAAALAALGTVEALHRPSLAAATLIGFVGTLAYEIRVVSRTPAFYWVRTTSG